MPQSLALFAVLFWLLCTGLTPKLKKGTKRQLQGFNREDVCRNIDQGVSEHVLTGCVVVFFNSPDWIKGWRVMGGGESEQWGGVWGEQITNRRCG